ncbi:MAG: hypothetical protein EOO07_17270 [Chitinophagaceae bacterium]|nr:MAG: hypothetical protein EOO07_17270 [Chitinophagaceae bacterium]
MKNLMYTLALVVIAITSSNAQQPIKLKLEGKENKSKLEVRRPNEKVQGVELRSRTLLRERKEKIHRLQRMRRMEHKHRFHGKRRVEIRRFKHGHRHEVSASRGRIDGRRLEGNRREKLVVEGRRSVPYNPLTVEQRAEKAATAMQKRLNLSDKQKQEVQSIELGNIKRNEEWRLQDEKERKDKIEQRKALATDTRTKIEKVLTEEQRKMLGNPHPDLDRRAERTPPPPAPIKD